MLTKYNELNCSCDCIDHMKIMSQPVTLTFEEKDLKHFGVMTYGYEDWTSFVLDGGNVHFEAMLLRKVIVGLGYQVTSQDDYHTPGTDKCMWEVSTTYPWDRFRAL